MQEKLSTVGFPFPRTVSEPVIHLVGVGIEDRVGKSYFFDNSGRNIDCYLFQYTLDGSGILEIGGEPHVLSAGKAFFTYIPGDTKYYCNPEDTHWEFIFVFFSGKSMMPYYEKVSGKFGQIFELDRSSPPVRRAFAMHKDAENGLIDTPFSAASAAFDFVCKLCAEADSVTYYSPLTKKAVGLISENFHRAVGISDVADALGVSASHLSRSFAADTGASPIEYLTKVRINHALRLLVSTEDPVDAVARASGFDNGNYFCKVFKKYTGTTPTAYRKLRKL